VNSFKQITGLLSNRNSTVPALIAARVKSDLESNKASALLFIVLSAVLIGQGCQGSGSVSPSVSRWGNSSSSEIITSSIPPFATREPASYQAVRITTTTESAGPASSPLETRTIRVFIAREGDRRREEYEDDAGEKIVYLENSQGRFVLIPSNKVYAELNSAEALTSSVELPQDAAEISADRLLHETHNEASYQKLGIENVDGRTATKYRITKADSSNGAVGNSETLIWIDESLGMPIRSESTFAGAHYSKVLMELKNLSLSVDDQLFELAGDFKKVDARLIPSINAKRDRRQKTSQNQ
jgi:outer membrane lipoprotein-sorting protein